MKNKLNCLDLFSGGGGLTEGFYNAGFNIVAHVEKDKDACLTLKTRNAYHWLLENNQIHIYQNYLKKSISRDELYSVVPKKYLNNVICEEMSSSTRKKIFKQIDEILQNEKVNIIIGGPPCQAYSIIGRARDINNMLTDKRKYLYKEYIQYIKKYQPEMYIFENVTGILSSTDEYDRSIINKIKNAFNYIGYTFKYEVLNSSDYGVLQDRERVIICGWKKELNLKYPKFDTNINKYTINQLFSDLPKLNAGESGIEYTFQPSEIHQKLKIRNEKWTLLTQHNARKNNDNDLSIYKICQNKFVNNNIKINYSDLPDNLKTHNNQSDFKDRFKVINGNGISHTVVAHIAKDGHHYIHPDPSQTRSITVREAARIQSFPDNYYFEKCRTSAFRQIGNAVPPLMAESIAYGCLNSLIEL